MLTALGDKLLSSSIKNGVFALCPTIDLVALATQENQVQIFRMNGEFVFGVPKKRPEGHVTRLQWKPNGRLLAVGYDDSVVLLVNTHTGGIVHKLENKASERSAIECLGWGLSLCDPSAAKTRIEKAGNGLTLEGLIDYGFQGSMLDVPPDLPAELAALDVEALLPKISILPALNRDDDLFSSRASLDSLFHGIKKEDQESTNALVIGAIDGRLTLSVYDSFSLGDISTTDPSLVLNRHASHPYSSTHALLWTSKTKHDRKLYFQAIDIRPITDAGRCLSLIASKTTQLQNLLRYLALAQQQIMTEFKNSQDLPKKFMRNIEESLQEHDHCSFIDAAYHLAVTGHCYETMKEWLVDELADRGQKRWEKATTSGYENVRQYTHENLIPGLQRFSVLMSRLRGLSKFQESSIALGLETQELDQIFDTLNCLELLSHRILIYTNRELQQFQAFAAWLKHEIEIQAIDPTSTTADEHLEKDHIPDYPRILEYIQGPMLSSQLYELLDLHLDDQRPTWDIAREGSVLYEHYKSDIKRLRNASNLDKRLPGLQTLITHLQEQCTKVFAKISAAQGRQIRLGDLHLIGDGISQAEICVLPEDDTVAPQRMNVFIAKVRTSNNPSVTITKVSLSITNGISSTESTGSAHITFPTQTRVLDLKFADAHTMILVLEEKTLSRILFIPFRPISANNAQGLRYSSDASAKEYRPDAGPDSTSMNDYYTKEEIESVTKHAFPSPAQPWRPGRIEVNGRQGRRALCVASQDGARYVLLDIDSWMHRSQDEDDSGGEEEEQTME